MPPKRVARKEAKESSDDEDMVFSGSSDDQSNSSSSSSDDSEKEERKRRKSRKSKKRNKKSKKRKISRKKSDSDSSDDDEDEIRQSKQKKKSKKSKHDSYIDDEEDEALEKISSKPDNPPSKCDIVPLTEDELKERYRYKKHTCKLSNIPMKKDISGQDACRPGRPAEIGPDKVKLHYVVHYINRGVWDHIVAEEGEKEGKIDSYNCNVCSKRFKNYLEKKEYPGRGSALCHVATDHGRLLKAMQEDKEVNMKEDILAVAKFDKQFNDTYRAYLDQQDDSYVMADEEIITVKESLVWKLYEQKHQAKTQQEKNKADKTDKSKSQENKVSPQKLKNLDPHLQEVLRRSKPRPLKCPLCEREGKPSQSKEGQSFRLHFFTHYKEEMKPRLDNLERGDSKTYYCDICPNKKPNKGATEEGAKTSTICHLAIQHHELRPFMEKDDRLSEDFKKDVYYDVDLKKAHEELKQLGLAQESTVPSSPPPIATKNVRGRPARPTENSPIKPQKNKPGPKPKLKGKKAAEVSDETSELDDEENEEIPDFVSDDDDDSSTEKKKKKSKKSSSSASRDPTIMKQNKEYIRKRRPLNITMDDLDLDMEVEEDTDYHHNTNIKPSLTRTIPKRKCVKKIDDEEENSD